MCLNRLNCPIMKKIICVGIMLLAIIGMGSCDYDDSDDIDIIRPNDSTRTALAKTKALKLVDSCSLIALRYTPCA